MNTRKLSGLAWVGAALVLLAGCSTTSSTGDTPYTDNGQTLITTPWYYQMQSQVIGAADASYRLFGRFPQGAPTQVKSYLELVVESAQDNNFNRGWLQGNSGNARNLVVLEGDHYNCLHVCTKKQVVALPLSREEVVAAKDKGLTVTISDGADQIDFLIDAAFVQGYLKAWDAASRSQ